MNSKCVQICRLFCFFRHKTSFKHELEQDTVEHHQSIQYQSSALQLEKQFAWFFICGLAVISHHVSRTSHSWNVVAAKLQITARNSHEDVLVHTSLCLSVQSFDLVSLHFRHVAGCSHPEWFALRSAGEYKLELLQWLTLWRSQVRVTSVWQYVSDCRWITYSSVQIHICTTFPQQIQESQYQKILSKWNSRLNAAKAFFVNVWESNLRVKA